LQALNDFIGAWNGSGGPDKPKPDSKDPIWKETIDWSWRFKGDDAWMSVGSDNLNRRSWTNDSEASCAVVDGTGRLARETRLRLWAEHLGRVNEGPDELQELSNHRAGFVALQRAAGALDAWYDGGCRAPRPKGRLRSHHVETVGPVGALWARPIYQTLVDPDGRPRSLRRADRF
jgi:hypothetical protein